MNTTESAAQKLRGFLVQRCFDIGLGFRIKNACDESGHRAAFSIKVDHQQPDDVVIQSNGVKLLADKETAGLLNDYELDYQDEPVGGFSFKANNSPTRS